MATLHIGQRLVHLSNKQWKVDPRWLQCRHFVTTHVTNDRRKAEEDHQEKQLIRRSSAIFDEARQLQKQNKAAFHGAVDMYLQREEKYRRGHVEFIYSAMNNLKEFGSEKDLYTYKKILQVFPVKKMIPKSTWQVEMMHYPKQQQCAIDLMDEMEYNGVIPDNDFGMMLAKIFGTDAHAFRKFQRMLYWMPKFKNLNPYPIPANLPQDHIVLAVLALKRMAVDLENSVSVFQTRDIEESPADDTFIASSQSPTQKKLLLQHPLDKPVIIEGGYTVWMRHVQQTYFVLSADPDLSKFQENEDEDDLFDWDVILDEEKPRGLTVPPSIHEQPDMTVLASCITGTATKDSLVSWIRALQQSNPRLEKIPVVFKLHTPEYQVEVFQKAAASVMTENKRDMT